MWRYTINSGRFVGPWSSIVVRASPPGHRRFILVINIYDDMLVYGAIQIQHDYALARVLQRMEDLGLTLNKAKCKFSHPKAIFKSHIQKPPQGHILWDEIHQRGNVPNARLSWKQHHQNRYKKAGHFGHAQLQLTS